MNAMSTGHTAVIEACLPHGLAKPFPANQFSLMVTTGAKGSQINHAMIAVGLGQHPAPRQRWSALARQRCGWRQDGG